MFGAFSFFAFDAFDAIDLPVVLEVSYLICWITNDIRLCPLLLLLAVARHLEYSPACIEVLIFAPADFPNSRSNAFLTRLG